jgi:Tfp pilus assembly protein PilO
MSRERTALIVVVLVAILGAAWLLVVSPERQQATKLSAQVVAAKAQLASAESQLAGARAAQSKYAAAYTAVVSLGKAVPASEEVPALIDQLTQASNEKSVDFNSITPGATTGAGAVAATAGSGVTPQPFTFTFEGTYFALEHLLNRLADFTTLNSSGSLDVNGRLLTIQSVKLAPSGAVAVAGAAPTTSKLTGTITASAYTMAAGASLTGATATSPAGAAAPASSTTSASSPAAPATVTVNP